MRQEDKDERVVEMWQKMNHHNHVGKYQKECDDVINLSLEFPPAAETEVILS